MPFAMSGDYMMIMIIGMIMGGIGALIGARLKSKFRKYSQVPIAVGLSGKEVAEKMLADYGVYDVQVLQGQGFLSDHYNPGTKIINLSPDVYNGRSVAAAAVAAHECGHAVQHNTAYAWLKMRSTIVPIVSVASRFQQMALIGSIMLIGTFPQLLLVTIALFAVTTAFALITLPVEFDASNRALAWLDESRITEGEEYTGAKDALWWAAMTYVASALSAVAMLMYLLSMYLGRRN